MYDSVCVKFKMGKIKLYCLEIIKMQRNYCEIRLVVMSRKEGY